MAKTQQLLDELDEARIQLRTYQRGLANAILGVLASLASMICGALLGHGAGQIVLFVLLGVAGLLTSVTGGGFWFWFCNTERDRMGVSQGDSPAARLRAAERAYRNNMLAEADDR
jgi:hypothetical protein